jgi:hypothetical protein
MWYRVLVKHGAIIVTCKLILFYFVMAVILFFLPVVHQQLVVLFLSSILCLLLSILHVLRFIYLSIRLRYFGDFWELKRLNLIFSVEGGVLILLAINSIQIFAYFGMESDVYDLMKRLLLVLAMLMLVPVISIIIRKILNIRK